MKKALSILLAVVLLAAMSVPVFAVDFTESIEAKIAPEVTGIEQGGTTYAALIVDSEGNTIEGVPMLGERDDGSILELVIVSAAEKEKAVLPEIKEAIEKAEAEIKQAEDIGQLSEGLDEEIESFIDSFFADAEDKPEIPDLVVSDVFDGSLILDRSVLEHLEPGERLRVKIKPNFQPGSFFVLLHNVDGKGWIVEKDVEWTEDGCLIITVDSLSVFAFAVDKAADLSVKSGAPASPKTDIGTGFRPVYAVLAALCVVAAVFFFVKSAKKAKAK